MPGGQSRIQTLLPAVLAFAVVAGLMLFSRLHTPESAAASSATSTQGAPMIAMEEPPANAPPLQVVLAGATLLGVILCTRLLTQQPRRDPPEGFAAE